MDEWRAGPAIRNRRSSERLQREETMKAAAVVILLSAFCAYAQETPAAPHFHAACGPVEVNLRQRELGFAHGLI